MRKSLGSSIIEAFLFSNRSAFTVKTNLCFLCLCHDPVPAALPLTPQTVLALQRVSAVIGNFLASQHLHGTRGWNIQAFLVGFGHTFRNPNKSMVCFDCKFVYFYGLVYDVSNAEYVASSYRNIHV
jgi:hypothetical protein